MPSAFFQGNKGRRQPLPAMRPLSAGFVPIATPGARVLILGSLPGAESLRRQQYYAKPQNAFWRIMSELWGFAPDLPYADRISALVANDIALWDVCAAAHRPGSLDSDIDPVSVQANDFASFYASHPKVALLCFNGAKAADLYSRYVRPQLAATARDIASLVLPSTSPAHASMSLTDKTAAWRSMRERR